MSITPGTGRQGQLICYAVRALFRRESAGRAKGSERTESAICKTTDDLQIPPGVPGGRTADRRNTQVRRRRGFQLKNHSTSGDGVINTDTCQEKRTSPVTVRRVEAIDISTTSILAFKAGLETRRQRPHPRNTTCDPWFKVGAWEWHFRGLCAPRHLTPHPGNLDEKRRNLHLSTNTQTGAEGLGARAANGIEAGCDDGPSAPAVCRGYGKLSIQIHLKARTRLARLRRAAACQSDRWRGGADVKGRRGRRFFVCLFFQRSQENTDILSWNLQKLD